MLARAESYFEAGAYDKAKIEYLNLLKADSKNATAIERLGMIWFEQGAPLRALPFLQTARDLAPDNLKLRGKLAAAYGAVGHVAEARKEALTMLEQSPNHDEAILLLADTSVSAEDIEFAEQTLREAAQPDRASVHLATATLLLRKGEGDSVQPEVEKALALDPKSSLAHMAMAHLWWSKNDLTRAGEEFKIAADLAPVRSTARMKFAEFKMNSKAEAEAKLLLHEITRKAPDYLPAWTFLAQIAYGEKKYDEALALLANSLRRDGGNFDALMLQSAIWLARGDVDKAVQSLEALDERHPNMPPLKYQLARAYLQNNKAKQAAIVLNDAVAINPDYLEAHFLLATANLRSGDAQAAVASLEALLKKRPKMMLPQLMLVEAFQSLARLDDAATLLREQIAASPQSSAPQFLLGTVLQKNKQEEEARAAFQKAYELEPDNFLYFSKIIELDLAKKDFPTALQRVQAELQKTPGSAGMHFLKGKIHATQGDWANAEVALLESLKLDAGFSGASALLISTYMSTKRLPQALGQLEGILGKNPKEVSALLVAALIYEQMDDFGKARDYYERILTVSPEHGGVMNNLAYLYSEKLNQLDKAYELARKAATLQPRDAGAADNLGWVLYKRGEYPQALALLQTSAEKLGDIPEVQFHLGMASYSMGQMDAAKKAFQTALKSPEEFPGKAEAQRRLAMLDTPEGKPADISSEALEAMLKQQPEDLLVRMRLGEAYERQGEFAKAEAAYEQALKVNPRLPAPALKLAQLNGGPLKNREKAIEFAKKAKDLAPNDPIASGTLGALVFQAGNFSWAYSLLQESSRKRADDAVILRDFAWAAYSQGRLDEAQQAMQRVLKAAPDSPQAADAKIFLAMTALDPHSKDLSTAEPEVRKILEADPAYTPASMALAALQMQRGEAGAAVGTYRQVLQRFPDFAPAQKYLAALYLGDPENRPKARDLAMKARKTLPDDPELARTLAEISYERKDYKYALQLLNESAQKRPLNATGLYYLGMTHLQLKEMPRSRETLNLALAAGLTDPLATEARRVIAEMPPE